MKYVVLGQLITDDIYRDNGTVYKNVLGGVAYTIAGLKFWADEIGVCSRVGRDFETIHGHWFAANGIDTKGIRITAKKSPHSIITYDNSEERVETPVQGCAPLWEMMPEPEEIPENYKDCKGLYIFNDCDLRYWDKIYELKKQNDMTVIWEIKGSSAVPANRESISRVLRVADILSVNYSEASTLCGENEPGKIIDDLLKMGAENLYFHIGAQGAYTADKTACWHVEAYRTSVLDVTGGGNSATGGYLAGFCDSGGDICRAAQCANASASFMIEQYGIPALIDGHISKKARTRADSLSVQKIF